MIVPIISHWSLQISTPLFVTLFCPPELTSIDCIHGLPCPLASCCIRPMEGGGRRRLGPFIPPVPPRLSGLHGLAVSISWGLCSCQVGLATELVPPGLVPLQIKMVTAHESSLLLVLDYCTLPCQFPLPTHAFVVPC